MTALPQPCLLTIAEYLDGEENSPVKHEYLGGTVHAMAGATNQHDLTIPSLKVLLFVEPETPLVILHRRKPEGGFAIESHAGLDAVIPVPEIEASLPLAALYERVELKA